MKKFIPILILSFLTVLYQVSAQKIQVDRYIISEEKWLPNQTINCIFQDSEGLLWVGTGSGLYCYDGHQVRHFATHPKKTNTLFTNRVTDVAEDGAGRIVVAMESGLSLLTKASEKFFTLSKMIEPYNRLRLMPNGKLWIAAGGGRLYHLSAVNSDTVIQSGVSNPIAFQQQVGKVNDLLQFNPQDLLIGSSGGLFRFDPTREQVSFLSFPYAVEVLKKTKSGRLLVGTKANGLFEITIEGNTVSIVHQYHFGTAKNAGFDHITSISEGPHGRLLVSTRRMYYLAHTTEPIFKFEQALAPSQLLEDNNIETSYIDHSGVIWIGTLRGLLKVRPADLLSERIRIQVPGQQLLNQQIQNILAENDERLWINTKDDGVHIFNPTTQSFQKISLPADVHRMAKSEKGYYIALGNSQVYRFDIFSTSPVTTPVLTTNQDVRCGLEISPGEWWFGCTDNGLLNYSDTGEALYGDLLRKINQRFNTTSTINYMMRDSQGNVWIGSRGDGLLKVNLRSGKIQKYSGMKMNGEISRRILHLREDSKGRIWVATREGGLYLYHPEKDNFHQYTVDDGLPSNVVCAIGEDQNQQIIISTDNGIALYQENAPIAFLPYNQQDGIEFTNFSFNAVAETSRGDVYFGNSNGLYRIRHAPQQSLTKPGFYWSAFSILHKEGNKQLSVDRNEYLRNYDPEKGIQLRYRENSFEVGFSLLNFANPDKTYYAYRLKGRDEDWHYLLKGSQEVYFHDLKPGSYELQVKAADSYGNWTNQIHSLAIQVAPPFWLSWPAYLIYMLFVVVSGYVLYKLLTRMNRLQEQLKEKAFLMDLQGQQMIHFSDLSHEIKNRLSLILGPLEKALTGKKVNQAVLNNLYEQTLRLKRISDQIMNLRKSEAGEFLLEVSQGPIIASLERLCHETEPLAIVRDIRLLYNFGPEPDEAWFDEQLIEIILLNLLNNAIKYTPSGGQVKVSGQIVELTTSDLPDSSPNEGLYLQCSISDTGIGIPNEDIKKLFDRFYRASNARVTNKREGAGIGLDLVARLIKKHRGFIDIVSQAGDGTEVEFYLPIEKKHFQLNETKLSGQSFPILEKAIPTPQPPTTLQGSGQPKVLLVDDDPDLLSHLQEHLSPHFQTLPAHDGIEAWKYLLTEPVDLIISDLSMPGMDGLTLLKKVKGNAELQQLPFIILTGRNSESQKLVCLQNGVDDFIDKPFSVNLIVWRAKNLIESRMLLRSQFARRATTEPDIEQEKSSNELFIEQVVALVEKNIRNSALSVEFLADQCAMSRATFYRKMESLLDQPPSVFIRTYRLKKAAKLLQSGNYYIAEVAYQTGFSNPKYFSKCFQKEFGASPSEYIKTLTDASPN